MSKSRIVDLIEGKKSDHPLVELIRASEIEPKAVQWLWHGWLARGKFHILAGKPGTGKTTVALALAATITSAGRWPDGTPCREAGDVVIWSGDDDPADTLTPRLMAAGADMKRVHFVGDVRNGSGPRQFDLADDVPLLARQLETLRPELLIIDPIIDNYRQLADLASKVDCAVLGIFCKLDDLDLVIFAHVALEIMRTATSKRIIYTEKSNIGTDNGSLRFNIEQTEVAPGIVASRIMWEQPSLK